MSRCPGDEELCTKGEVEHLVDDTNTKMATDLGENLQERQEGVYRGKLVAMFTW